MRTPAEYESEIDRLSSARNLEAKARELMDATPGLGELQAYRVAQMQHAMRKRK